MSQYPDQKCEFKKYESDVKVKKNAKCNTEDVQKKMPLKLLRVHPSIRESVLVFVLHFWNNFDTQNRWPILHLPSSDYTWQVNIFTEF